MERNSVVIRSRAPSLIDVDSQNEKVFAQLPDLIQEAAVSAEFASPNLRISRVPNDELFSTDIDSAAPMFYITRSDSGIEMPDLNVTDENIINKYGSDLTANFADIKAHGAKAFFQKTNLSDGSTYSLCACATGYMWVHISPIHISPSLQSHLDVEYSDLEIQIGTFALKAKALSTVEISCRFKFQRENDYLDGELALLCSTVLAKYLRLRMMGQQYEYAAETAILQSRKELSPLRVVDPNRFDNMDALLRDICLKAPMPPVNDVSLISRSMITGRWYCWSESSILRTRYFLPQRILRCLMGSRYDSTDLLSGCFQALGSRRSRIPLLSR